VNTADHPDSKGRSSRARLLLLLAFATIYFVWGSTYLAIRVAVETMPPFLMAGTRFLVAGTLLFAFSRRTYRGSLTREHWRSAFIVGGLMLLGGNGLVCWAEQTVASGLAALIIATVPLWMVMLDWWFFRRNRPSALTLLGLLTGLAGIWILVQPSGASIDRVDPAGAFALLTACVAWAAGSLYARNAAFPPSTFLATAMQMVAGGAALIVWGSLLGEWGRLELGKVPLGSWMALAYLIVFGGILALSAYTYLLKASTAARVATYAYVNPVVALGLGWFFLDERISSRTLVASAVILAAVVTIVAASPRRPQTSAPRKSP